MHILIRVELGYIFLPKPDLSFWEFQPNPARLQQARLPSKTQWRYRFISLTVHLDTTTFICFKAHTHLHSYRINKVFKTFTHMGYQCSNPITDWCWREVGDLCMHWYSIRAFLEKFFKCNISVLQAGTCLHVTGARTSPPTLLPTRVVIQPMWPQTHTCTKYIFQSDDWIQFARCDLWPDVVCTCCKESQGLVGEMQLFKGKIVFKWLGPSDDCYHTLLESH